MNAFLYLRVVSPGAPHDRSVRLLMGIFSMMVPSTEQNPSEVEYLVCADLAARTHATLFHHNGLRGEYWLAIVRGWTVEYRPVPMTPSPAPEVGNPFLN